jgi:hypothetical protein
MILRSLDLASLPMATRNLCRPEVFSVHEVGLKFGELFGRKPNFKGTENTTALIGNAQKLCGEMGAPTTHLSTMVNWIADWIHRCGRTLGKPTHFETRDGKY